MRCLLFIPRRAKTRNPWRKNTIKPWSRFFLIATGVVYSNMASVVISIGLLLACLTLSNHFHQNFFTNLGCPRAPPPVEAKAAEVLLVETAKDPKEGIVEEE